MKFIKTWITETSEEVGVDGKPVAKFKIYHSVTDLKKEYGEHADETVCELRKLSPEEIERLFQAEEKTKRELLTQEVIDLIGQCEEE